MANVQDLDRVGGRSTDLPAPYRVLVTCGEFEPGFRGGGPVRSVARVLDTAPPGFDVLLVTRDRDLGSDLPYPGLSGRWIQRGCSLVYYLNTRDPRQWLRLGRELRSRPVDLLYVNSLWSRFSLLPVLAAATGLLPVGKVLLAPRGELSPGALSLKARKKRLFLLLWGPFLRRRGVLWQACSDLESTHIATTFPWARILLSPNAVALPHEPVPPRTMPSDSLRLVFIGRIAPKKNLELALRALVRVSRTVTFDIFGPLEDRAYWSRCQRLIAGMPANVRVRYLGELPHAEVLPTFGAYDAFLFPTSGENFGHVILESLAASCPVVCSADTPWSELIATGGGAVVRPLTADRLAVHVDRLAAASPAERWRARKAAGDAYRSWRQQEQEHNVLEDARYLC